MLFIILMVVLWIAAVVGWILNIVKIIKTMKSNEGKSSPVSSIFIARCIGVLAAPLGSILGYMRV